MFGFEEANSFAVGYSGRLCLPEQHRHNLCRSPTGIIHAHLISSLPSVLWCLLSLQHFSLPCPLERNIFVFSNALIYPKLPWIVLLRLRGKKFITIHMKEGRGTWSGGTCLSFSSPRGLTGGHQPHSQGGHPSPWGQGKACRYLWDLEGKE